MSIQAIGDSFFHSSLASSTKFCLRDVLHVPSISKNLLSVSKFSRDNGVYFLFFADHFIVKRQDNNQIVLRGTVKHGLYALEDIQVIKKGHIKSSIVHPIQTHFVSTVPLKSLSDSGNNKSITSLWHNRLGHPSINVVKRVMRECNIVDQNNDKSVCKACYFGKFTKSPSPSTNTVYSSPLELIHTNVWGPAPISSSASFHYYVHFTDAFSRFTWIYLLGKKSDVIQAFINFKTHVELQLNSKIKAVQSDWGGEYRTLSTFLANHGISHRRSCPYVHEQNGLAERRHRHITEVGLTLLAQGSLPMKYWDDAFITAVHLINRIPSSVLQ